jgi:hypothetical protein
MATGAVRVEISFAGLGIAHEYIQLETYGISAGGAALGAHGGQNAVDIFGYRHAIGLHQGDWRIVFGQVSEDELAVLVIHGNRRAQNIVALTHYAAHIRSMATGAIGGVQSLAA